MSVTLWVMLAVCLAVFFWAVGAYNRLVRLKNAIANAFGQIDVQLKRRYDLIPNLVEVARKYLAHESETLEAVIAARNQARTAEQAAAASPLNAGALGALAGGEQLLGGALGRLFAVAEAYPELRANESFSQLQARISSLENAIADRRELYNEAVNLNNVRVEQFPDLFIARLFRFDTKPLLDFAASEITDVDVKDLFASR